MTVAPETRTSGARDASDDRAGALIRLAGIEKTYGGGSARTWILRDVSLTVRPGEFVSIMGPSGAGKSTLLHVLGMYEDEWQGEYWLGEEPVHAMKSDARARLRNASVGFVFQQYHLLDDLTVYENIELPLTYRRSTDAERQARVAEALDRFRLVAKRGLYPRQLSGGQQQLVAVARAIVGSPRLVLADEPTGNLHSAQGKQIMELFGELNAQGATIIQVTHSETNAGYGGRVVRLDDGRLHD